MDRLKLFPKARTSAVCLAALLLAGCVAQAAPSDVTLRRPSRWLEVTTLSGEVTFDSSQEDLRPAQLGDRLIALGESLSTGPAAAARLGLDAGIGSLSVRSNTELEVAELQTHPSGGRITRLTVPRGQVNFQIRRFTHSTSSLTIETPAGIAGVRGTNFGVGVDDSGITTVATTAGSVAASAQGVTVVVNDGFFSTIVPGEPPSPPQQIGTTNLRVGVRRLEVLDLPSGDRGVRITGVVHPINSITINGITLETDETGSFGPTEIPLEGNRLNVTVSSPVWGERIYGVTLTGSRWELDLPENYTQFVLPARGRVIEATQPI